MTPTDKANLRSLVRGTYDLQKLRIQTGARVVATIKVKLGFTPSEKEDVASPEAKRILKDVAASYKRLTDGVVESAGKRWMSTKFVGDGVIDTMSEYSLVKQYVTLLNEEETNFKVLAKVLEGVDIYKEFLGPTKGVGPAMAAVIVSEFDIHKAKYPSSLHKYAGLDVASDGRARSLRAEHLVDVSYTAKDGSTKTKKSITFNPFLRSKLIGVLGSSFLRAGENKYSKIYNDYKVRLEHHVAHKDKTKLHRHNMAIRYMVKIFLIDLYVAWRTVEGLPVHPPYAEAKLGLKHGSV